jgi:hypothetical protein
MLSRRQFFVEAFRRAKTRAGKEAEERHVPLLLIAGAIALLALFGVGIFASLSHAAETGVVLGVLGVAVLAFLWWFAFESYYTIYREEYQRADKASVERTAALERVRPKLRIVPESKPDPIQQLCRIRVKSECDIQCSFGADLVRVSGQFPLPLPFALRVSPGSDNPMQSLPAGGERTVDVIGVSEEALAVRFFGIADYTVDVEMYRATSLTISIYSDVEGAADEMDFNVDLNRYNGIPFLIPVPRVIVEEPVARPLPDAKQHQVWTRWSKTYRRLLYVLGTMQDGHKRKRKRAR